MSQDALEDQFICIHYQKETHFDEASKKQCDGPFVLSTKKCERINDREQCYIHDAQWWLGDFLCFHQLDLLQNN